VWLSGAVFCSTAASRPEPSHVREKQRHLDGDVVTWGVTGGCVRLWVVQATTSFNLRLRRDAYTGTLTVPPLVEPSRFGVVQPYP
jgi:hypothetical protein